MTIEDLLTSKKAHYIFLIGGKPFQKYRMQYWWTAMRSHEERALNNVMIRKLT